MTRAKGDLLQARRNLERKRARSRFLNALPVEHVRRVARDCKIMANPHQANSTDVRNIVLAAWMRDGEAGPVSAAMVETAYIVLHINKDLLDKRVP